MAPIRLRAIGHKLYALSSSRAICHTPYAISSASTEIRFTNDASQLRLIARWFEVAGWAVLPGDRRLFGLFDEAL